MSLSARKSSRSTEPNTPSSATFQRRQNLDNSSIGSSRLGSATMSEAYPMPDSIDRSNSYVTLYSDMVSESPTTEHEAFVSELDACLDEMRPYVHSHGGELNLIDWLPDEGRL